VIAIVIGSSAVSTLSLYAVMLTIVPLGLLLAPQPVRTDKRTIAAVIAAAAILIGAPAYAVVCNVCALCKTEWWFLYVECWFL
jgi:hypothetical protein